MNTLEIKHSGSTGGGTTLLRDSNIELYRIIIMLLIVAHHYVVNSGLTASGGPIYADPLSGRSLFLLIFGAWGKTGINCFVLITGYYMCTSRITLRKFMKLFLEWMFYRYVIQAIFWLTGYEVFSTKTLIKTILPITKVSDNFTSCYILFFLAIPFLNVMVKHLTEKQHRLLLLLCFFTYTVLGTFHRVTMNYVTWFIVIFFIGSYLRLYPKEMYNRKALWGWMTLISISLAVLSIIACAWIGEKQGKEIAYYFVSDSNTLLAVIIGISSFLFFKNLRIKQNRAINTISASTFGVLLIHAHSDSMRQWLWRDLLQNTKQYHSKYIILLAIGSVLGVYMISTLIDQCRIRLLEKPTLAYIDRHSESWTKKISKG